MILGNNDDDDDHDDDVEDDGDDRMHMDKEMIVMTMMDDMEIANNDVIMDLR